MARRTASLRQKVQFSPRFFVSALIGCLAAVLAFSQAAASIGLPIETFRPLGAGFFSTRTVQAEAVRDIAQAPSRSEAIRAGEIGRNELMHAPLNSRALWLVGQGFDRRGDTERARSVMNLAERISRRDAAVQLWLATDFLQMGDFARSLGHFDMMIRTNNDAAQVVTPELAKLIAHPEGRQELEPYFSEDNPWLLDLMWAAASELPTAEPLTTLLLERGVAAPDIEGIRPVYQYLLQKLLAEDSYDLALELFPRLPGADLERVRTIDPADSAGLVEGYPPFVWKFGDGGSQGGDIISVDEGRIGLEMYAAPGTTGIAGTKLVIPGRNDRLQWRLVARTDNRQSAARWVATCVVGPAAGATSQSPDLLAAANEPDRLMTMRIPGNCQLLRLDLDMSGGIGRSPASITVAELGLSDSSA